MTKGLFAAVLAGLALAPALAGAQPYELFDDSSIRRLTQFDIRGLDCRNLWVARNEIFNRNGFCFANDAGRMFFDNGDCFTRDVQLAPVERANIGLIQRLERQRHCR